MRRRLRLHLRPHGPCPPAREVAVFTADGSRLAARATWPGDADPKGEISVSVVKGELHVNGLACAAKVRLAP